MNGLDLLMTSRRGLGAFAVMMMIGFGLSPGHAQGIVGGARDGAYEGSRIAGPVGGVVGGAIGAGVGGAVGAVKGVIGIPDRGWHRGYECRGYYDRYHHFRCYR